jgi:hypothetical protein
MRRKSRSTNIDVLVTVLLAVAFLLPLQGFAVSPVGGSTCRGQYCDSQNKSGPSNPPDSGQSVQFNKGNDMAFLPSSYWKTDNGTLTVTSGQSFKIYGRFQDDTPSDPDANQPGA